MLTRSRYTNIPVSDGDYLAVNTFISTGHILQGEKLARDIPISDDPEAHNNEQVTIKESEYYLLWRLMKARKR